MKTYNIICDNLYIIILRTTSLRNSTIHMTIRGLFGIRNKLQASKQNERKNNSNLVSPSSLLNLYSRQ